MGVATSTFREGQDQLEAVIDDGAADTWLGRNRFLKLAGAGLFGAAVTTFLPNPEEALGGCGSSAPCFGYELCCAGCCLPNRCDDHCNAGWLGCPTGEQCWYTCSAGGKLIKCCDCRCNGCQPCICRYNVGTC